MESGICGIKQIKPPGWLVVVWWSAVMQWTRCVLSVIWCVGLLCQNTVAQTPYGTGSSGAGGFVPQLMSNQAWLSRPDFRFTLTSGLGGTPAVLLISTTPAASTFAGVPVWVDLSTVVSQPMSLLGGTFNSPGDGTGDFVVSLAALPPIAALAGFRFYAQAAVFDFSSGLPAVSNGVECELTLPPQLFVGTSVSGSNDPAWFLNPATGVVDYAAGTGQTNNVDGAVYTSGGSDIYINSAILGRIRHADLSGSAPVWNDFYTFSSAPSYGLGYDRSRQILWCIGDISTTAGVQQLELCGFDADKNSATYGQRLYNSMSLGGVGLIGVWTLSPDGNFAVIPSLISTTVFVFDTDPASADFLIFPPFLNMPLTPTSAFWANAAVAVSDDLDQIWVLRQPTGQNPAELQRYSRSLGAWIDHNPSTPGSQAMGPLSSPPIPLGISPTSLSSNRLGTPFFVASGIGSGGWVGRIDYDPANPSVFAWTAATGTTLGNTYTTAINPDGTQVAVTTWSPARVLFFDAGTMISTGSATLPGGVTNIYELVWR